MDLKTAGGRNRYSQSDIEDRSEGTLMHWTHTTNANPIPVLPLLSDLFSDNGHPGSCVCGKGADGHPNRGMLHCEPRSMPAVWDEHRLSTDGLFKGWLIAARKAVQNIRLCCKMAHGSVRSSGVIGRARREAQRLEPVDGSPLRLPTGESGEGESGRGALLRGLGNPEEIREHLCMPAERCTINDSSVHRKSPVLLHVGRLKQQKSHELAMTNLSSGKRFIVRRSVCLRRKRCLIAFWTIGDYLAMILPDISVSSRDERKLPRKNNGRTTENRDEMNLPVKWTTACGKSAVSARIAACCVPEAFRVVGFSLYAAVNPDSSGQSRC
ncbi:uncharacterized protein CLUP02_01522 [Colletotrichum lupini]|uniref:Uncharacterized protein n=1 Tax=Colletotrichum lupini TaxID=145971 RepID=A0A9Q8WA09_9PEZI|nr:uncharacterized protein CLUP02_01522 [Colletotrichum lupini]UQC74870.1 hypothetical protein CLUP02_01522 [Colletotrichum lupini]